MSKKYTGSFSNIKFTESHDTIPGDRQRRNVASLFSDTDGYYYALKRTILANSVLFASLGIPMLLHGQEVAEEERCVAFVK